MKKMNSWSTNHSYQGKVSAQSYLNPKKVMYATSSCGSACGAGDDTEEKPTEEPESSACGV